MSPSAEPLLLVPGLMCDRAVWEPLYAHLPASCLPLVAEHGDADSLPEMARRLLAAAPARFALAGHSMGARVAVEVLRQAPQRVTRLALLDTGHAPRAPGAEGEEEARKRHALLAIAERDGTRAMGAEWVKGMVAPQRLDDAPLIDAILDMFERKSAETFAAQIRALLARPDAGELLPQVGVPTLVLCGRLDSWAPVSQHEEMLARLPAGARLEVIEEAGHMSPMERPKAVATALRGWLEMPA